MIDSPIIITTCRSIGRRKFTKIIMLCKVIVNLFGDTCVILDITLLALFITVRAKTVLTN